MRRLIIPLLALPLLCACEQVSGLVDGLRRQEAAGERPPVVVRTVAAGRAETLPGQVYTGETEPARSVLLTAPYGGTLTALPVTKGERLSGGQAVAVVRSQSVESAVDIAEATLSQAQDAHARLQKVFASGAIPEVQKIEIETQLAKAEAAARAARRTRADGTVKTPWRGVVGELYVNRGEEVLPGQRIALLMDLSEIRVRIDVHENDISSVVVGTPAVVSVPALGLEDLPAVVTERGYVASPLSRSYACLLRLADPVPGLMPGMAVKASFAAPLPEDDRIVVPAAAVQMDTQGKYVWTVEGGRVQKTRITLGGYSGRGVVVRSGLLPGDRVIVDGWQKVSTGMTVAETL
ncbi:MAG: efflux RND transporter periplasmic adaptor subunit [Bacteroidales bacterium]|nr:efflux RND transporter periplasmic adaptor subunit [Bacteroidales bacterium]